MNTRLKLSQGAVRDQIRQSLYDTLTIVAAENPIAKRVFYTNVQNKALYLTNLRNNRSLEGQVSFRIQAFKISAHQPYSANAQALPLIMEHSSISLRVGEKFYWEGPMSECCGSLHVADAVSSSGFAAGTNHTVERHYSQLGLPRPFGIVFKKNETLDIAPVQSFWVDWECSGMSAAEIALSTPAADTKISFISYLKGLQRRPVQ